jgi:hypothetical protein
MKFTNVEQIKEAFLTSSNGRSQLGAHPRVRFSDIDENAPVLEHLLGTEYNTLSGYSFSEIMEALSHVVSHSSKDYLQDCKISESCIDEGSLNESFAGTTAAQSPFPVLNKGFTMYQYEKSVLPYFSHIFDLKGNRGLVYYAKLNSANAMGDVAEGDLLASPRELGKQTTNYIGTQAVNGAGETNVSLGTILSTETTIDGSDAGKVTLPYKPIAPNSVEITFVGQDGALKDMSYGTNKVVYLTNVGGKLGDCMVDLELGEVTLNLDSAAASDIDVKISYRRDVETSQGGLDNQAEVEYSIEAEHLTAENFSVKSKTNIYQQKLAQAIFGRDWNADLDNMLGAVYNREIAGKVANDIKQNIPANASKSYDITPTANTGENKLFTTQFLAPVISGISRLIAQNSGITGVRKLSAYLVSNDIVHLLEALPKFQPVEAPEDLMGGMAVVGTYNGTPVIAGYAPIVNSGDIMGVYKSKNQEFLVPAVFGTFMLPVIRDIYDQNNLAINKKQLIASGASKTVAPNLAAKYNVTGLASIGM